MSRPKKYSRHFGELAKCPAVSEAQFSAIRGVLAPHPRRHWVPKPGWKGKSSAARPPDWHEEPDV
jgi:hypothetical protein